MSWLFRRRIRVIPGVRLNLSKSGVTASIGVRGASITLGGKGGTYANVGIPGTGIYSRRKIGGGKNSVLDNSSEERFNPEQYEEQSSQPDEVFVSEDPLEGYGEALLSESSHKIIELLEIDEDQEISVVIAGMISNVQKRISQPSSGCWKYSYS